MKKIVILMMFCSSIAVFAQTSNAGRDYKYQTEVESKLNYNNSFINLAKYKTEKILEYTLSFKVDVAYCDETQKGMRLFLSNGEILEFNNLKLVCENTDEKNQNLKGSLILSPELFEKLSKTEIKNVTLGAFTFPVIFEEEGVNSAIFIKSDF